MEVETNALIRSEVGKGGTMQECTEEVVDLKPEGNV